MDASNVAAWWGAGVATVVLAWDIAKWLKAGPVPILSAQGGMFGLGAGLSADTKYITVRVTNRGERPTTLNSFGMFSFRNDVDRRARNPDHSYFFLPTTGQPLPCYLQAGSVWNGFVEQRSDIDDVLHNGLLEIRAYFAHSDKPVVSLVEFHRAGTEAVPGPSAKE